MASELQLKNDNADTKCPLFEESEDITVHVLKYEKAIKFTHIVLKDIARENGDR